MFDIFFKKRKKQYELEKAKSYSKIRELKSENKRLEKQVDFQAESFKRIQYLLNNWVFKGDSCFIERTKKGVNIFSVISYTSFEVTIYNLDDIYYNASWNLMLKTSLGDDNTIILADIQGGSSKGHGEIAMNYLIDYAKNQNIKKIEGKISQTDFLHFDRLISFYKKMKFKTDYNNFKEGSIIVREL